MRASTSCKTGLLSHRTKGGGGLWPEGLRRAVRGCVRVFCSSSISSFHPLTNDTGDAKPNQWAFLFENSPPFQIATGMQSEGILTVPECPPTPLPHDPPSCQWRPCSPGASLFRERRKAIAELKNRFMPKASFRIFSGGLATDRDLP